MEKEKLTKIISERHNIRGSVSLPSDLQGLGLNDVKDLYIYEYKKHPQVWAVDKSKDGKKFIVNHFIFSTGIADWIEKNYKKEGKTIPPKHYWQNVAIDYDTRAEANAYIVKELS